VDTAHAPHPGYGNCFGAKTLLLVLREPTQIPIKRFFV